MCPHTCTLCVELCMHSISIHVLMPHHEETCWHVLWIVHILENHYIQDATSMIYLIVCSAPIQRDAYNCCVLTHIHVYLYII